MSTTTWGSVVAGVVAVVGMTALGAVAAPAQAARGSLPASGTTVLQISSFLVESVESRGCGTLSVTALGAATVTTNPKGTVIVRLPVTSVVSPENPEGLRSRPQRQRCGAVDDCYDVSLNDSYVQNLGTTGRAFLNVTASTGSGRVDVFDAFLDPQATSDGFRARGDEVLGSGGSTIFNELGVGEPTGVFGTGLASGYARTRVHLHGV